MRTRVVRHESDLGRWELHVRGPHAHLRGLVHSYGGYVESRARSPVLRQEVPSTVVPVIVNFGAPWQVATQGAPPTAHDSFVAGLAESSAFVAASGPASCVQVDFTPLGAHMFFGLPMHELADRVVGLEDAIPHEARFLPERIASAAGWDERFSIVEDVLQARLDRARPPSAEVVWAWRALERSGGRVRVGALAERLGRSRRHLVDRFREQVGLPPKKVARIIRFGRVVERMRAHADLRLAELAFECGYYDQAHLNRDFRAFTGTSPVAFASRIASDGSVLGDPPR